MRRFLGPNGRLLCSGLAPRERVALKACGVPGTLRRATPTRGDAVAASQKGKGRKVLVTPWEQEPRTAAPPARRRPPRPKGRTPPGAPCRPSCRAGRGSCPWLPLATALFFPCARLLAPSSGQIRNDAAAKRQIQQRRKPRRSHAQRACNYILRTIARPLAVAPHGALSSPSCNTHTHIRREPQI